MDELFEDFDSNLNENLFPEIEDIIDLTNNGDEPGGGGSQIWDPEVLEPGTEVLEPGTEVLEPGTQVLEPGIWLVNDTESNSDNEDGLFEENSSEILDSEVDEEPSSSGCSVRSWRIDHSTGDHKFLRTTPFHL